MLSDLRFALRQLVKAPGFTLTAVVTLALGIGANTAIYSVIHGALRLPYPNAVRMVGVQNVFPQGSYYAISYPDFLEWRAKATSFSQLVASFSGRATWNGEAYGNPSPVTLSTGLASEGYFQMLGVKSIVGHDFLRSQHQLGSAPVCMVAEPFWRNELHADPGIIGKSLDLDSKSCTVVGVVPVVMPAGYRPTQVWLPLETNKPWDQHGTNYLFVRGVLRDGVTPAQAQAELSNLQEQINKQFPGNKHAIGVHPLSETYFGDLRPIMLTLLAAVGLILLIACVNLANMLLARASDRTHEFALRRALGASPGRLLRQSMTESLLLASLGTAAGLAVAFGLTHIPLAAWPKGFIAPSDVHLDLAILLFTCLLGITTGALFGMVPALRVLGRRDASSVQPNRSSTESRSHGRTRSILVVAEIALSMLLVVGALNVTMHFVSLLRADPGIDTQNAMVMTVLLPATDYPKPEDQRRFFDTLVIRLSDMPGVVAVGGSTNMPFARTSPTGDFEYEGQPQGSADKNPFAEKHYITPGYFASVRARMWQGRDFNSRDQAESPQVAIINRTMADKLWPGQNAIGKRITANNSAAVVIGIVENIQFARPGDPPAFQIYRPVDQIPQSALNIVVRPNSNFNAGPLTLVTPARAAVASIDPKLAIADSTSLDLLSQQAFAGQRTSTAITSVLGVLALLLASVGVYGVLAYTVSRREREFGIRIALGASTGRIVRLLYAGVSKLIFAGISLGILLAMFARVWIASRLGEQGTSAGAMVLGGFLLALAAVISAAVPVRRAIRVQPVHALRNE